LRECDVSKIAWSASRARRADEFRPLIGQLRALQRLPCVEHEDRLTLPRVPFVHPREGNAIRAIST